MIAIITVALSLIFVGTDAAIADQSGLNTISIIRVQPSRNMSLAQQSAQATQCPADAKYCGNGICCPGELLFLCAQSRRCFQTSSEAQKSCGNAYSICGQSVR